MTDNDKSITAPTPPVPITVIGTSDGLVQGTTAKTPPDQPNLIISVVSPLMAIVVRFINTYIGMVVGLLAAGMADSSAIPAVDFWHLLLKCGGLAIGGAVVLSLKDIVTIFGRLENKYPLLTGGV